MSEHPEQINLLLDHLFAYGPVWVYLIIFGACLIENLFPPFPGDSFIVAAGGLVALGRLEPIVTVVLIVVGGMTSVMILYFMGRRYGRAYFIRRDFKYFSAADIVRMEDRFRRWGALVLIVSRFVVGMRAALAIVAGIGRYPSGKMALFSTISYLIFCGLLFFAAFKLVENLGAIEYYFTAYNRIVWPILIVGAGVMIVLKVRKRRRETGR